MLATLDTISDLIKQNTTLGSLEDKIKPEFSFHNIPFFNAELITDSIKNKKIAIISPTKYSSTLGCNLIGTKND